MFSEELINEIPDEFTRYIVRRIDELGMATTKQHNDIRRELDLELGLSRGTASRKFTSAYYYLIRRMREEKEKLYDKYYDDNRDLSLENIAKAKNIDIDDLKVALEDYMLSYSIEEQIDVARNRNSIYAGKNTIFIILEGRVSGFSRYLRDTSSDVDGWKRCEMFFLDRVDKIYSDYLENNNLKQKQYVISGK